MFLCLVQFVGFSRPAPKACRATRATKMRRNSGASSPLRVFALSPLFNTCLIGTYVVAIIWLGWFGCDSDAPMLGLPFRIGFHLFDVLVCL
jgi:hypothetical protein